MYETGTATGVNDLFEKLRTFLKAGAVARGVLTLSGNAGDTETVVIGRCAVGTLTLTGLPLDGETVTLGTKVYTFQDVLVDVDGNVQIGADASESLDNLIAAINHGTGQGVLYANQMTVHPSVRAEAGAGDTMIVRAKEAGTGGNSIASTVTLTNGSFGGATLSTGGTKTYTFQTVLTNVDGNVLIGGSASASIDNLIAAITLGAGSGTAYAAATTAHPDVTAAAGAGDTMVLSALRDGPGGDTIATTETLANGEWDDATLLGGETGWTELQYDAGTPQIHLRAPGLSGTEAVHFGFRVNSSVSTDTYSLQMWMFKSFNPGLTFLTQPGTSGSKYMAAWDSAMPYWFIANQQRLIVVAKVSTVYGSLYIGKFLPYGTPAEYPQPYVILSQYNSSIRYSSNSESFRAFFDPGDLGAVMLTPDGAWRSGGNFRESSGEAAVSDSAAFVWPFNAADSSTRNRFRELRNNVDDSVTLFPLILMANWPSTDIWGELDGAFAASGFAASSEDTITENGVAHLLVQNVYRTARYYFAAVRLQ